MLTGYRIQIRPVLTVFSLLALGLLVALGSWQLHRLDWKRALIVKVEARVSAAPIPFDEAVRRAEAGEDMEYMPVIVSGVLSLDGEARVFGAYQGAPGSFSFAPLLRGSGETLYVNRGFTPQAVKTRSGSVAADAEIAGLFRAAERPSPPASWFRPTGQSADGLWFVRDPQQFAEQAGVKTQPYYIDAFAMPGPEWPKGGTTRLEFNNRHLEYALTWFGLALALAGVWFVFSLQKR